MNSRFEKALRGSLLTALVALFLMLPGCPLTETTNAALVEGDVYEVEIQILEDGTLYAVEIEASDDGEENEDGEDDDADDDSDDDADDEDGEDDEEEDGEESESGFSAQVEAVADDGSSCTVLGALTVVLEPEEGEELDEESLQITDLAVGMWIEAEGEFGADGIFYAEELEAADEEEIEIEAVLGDLTDTTFTMLGLTITYDGSTAIEGEEEEDEEDEEEEEECEQEGENEGEC